DEYVDLIGRLKAAGFIDSVKDIWWDVRPSPDNGTIEVRICDMPPDMPGLLGLTALIQCLVAGLSDEVDHGQPAPDHHPLMVRQNRWRACRHGLGATFVDPVTLEARPARGAIEDLVRRLRPIAGRLGCAGHLESVLELASRPTGSERQLALYQETGDLAD